MKILKHFKLVTRHKWYVFKNCVKAGLYWQGLTHDLSKYSPIEFFESVKYFTGHRSPIDECKKDKGYSMAWQHHKGRNPHHYEYWVDNFDGGGTPLQMPFKYALELVCDYLAAGQAYNKKNFSYLGEYEWWLEKKSKPLLMHQQTIYFIDEMLQTMAKENSSKCLKNSEAFAIYRDCSWRYNFEVRIKTKEGMEEGI